MNDITQETVNLIKQFEGLRLIAYQDKAGVWTIGWGHTKGVYRGMKITVHGAKQFLIDDLADAAAGVSHIIKRPMTNHEFGAFLSLTHNIGVGAFKTSTTARRFNAGNKLGAAEALQWFNKRRDPATDKKVISNGLVKRRAIEADYFDDPDAITKALLIPPREFETAAGTGGERRAVPPAWPMLGTITALLLVIFNEHIVPTFERFVEFFNGFI